MRKEHEPEVNTDPEPSSSDSAETSSSNSREKKKKSKKKKKCCKHRQDDLSDPSLSDVSDSSDDSHYRCGELIGMRGGGIYREDSY